MKAKVALLMAGMVASTVLLAGAAGAGGAVATKIPSRGPQGDFAGRILSASDSCLAERRVSVYQQVGDDQDPRADDRIASDTSDQNGNHGEWSVGNTGFRDGKFYAKVAKAPGCKGDRSKTIELVDGEPQ
ncbi:MAG: hypothetical protein ACXWXQ_04375 [Actinomycetota bacterium]